MLRWLALGFCLAAALALYAAVTTIRRQWRLSRHGVKTRGVVVRHQARRSGFHPVVAFADEHGIRREVASPLGTSVRWPRVGRELPVHHLPGRPQTAEPDTGAHRFWSLSLVLLVAVIFPMASALLCRLAFF
ncbi:hypothetical protein GCM10009828_100850 [Actinoplanes couchii]|uniref:DUF3592 domain-containing protein n=1 Tax=Actinoplanes couchii TaxID=403638 RepID=A0ABQ3XLV9_9ACTN|nr:hypothetical protein Aco03nite_079040 [Actinoplanes couchii]